MATASGTYYIRARNDTSLCWSTGSGSAGVVVNTLPANPTAVTPSSGVTICNGQSSTVKATSSGNTINWYTVSTGGTLVGNSASNTNYTVYPDTTTRYYAEAKTAAGCKSAARAQTAVITVNQVAPPAIPSPQQVCYDTSYTFTWDSVLAGSGGNQVEWATNSAFTGSTIISSGGSINKTVGLGTSDTIWLRSKNSSNGCLSTAVFTFASVNEFPEDKEIVFNDTIVLFYSSPSIVILNSQEGVKYSLYAKGQEIVNQVGNGDSLHLLIPPLDTSIVFSVYAKDTLTNCEILLGDSMYVDVIRYNNTFKYLDQILSKQDTNFYALNAEAQAYLAMKHQNEESFEDAEEEEEDGEEMKYNRWYHYWKGRVGENGNMNTANHEYQKYLAYNTPFMCEENPQYDANWRCLGPFNSDQNRDPVVSSHCTSTIKSANQGLISAIAIHPSNQNIIYVGTWNGGVWKTTNGLQTSPSWSNITDMANYSSFGVNSLVLHPANPDFIVAATGNNALGVLSHGGNNYGVGVIIYNPSTGTWLNTPLTFDPSEPDQNQWARNVVRKIIIDPASTLSNTIIYAITKGQVKKMVVDATTGVGTLTDLWGNANDNSMSDMEMDPQNSSVIWVASKIDGILKSTNGGTSWTPTTNLNLPPGYSWLSTCTMQINCSSPYVVPTTGDFQLAITSDSKLYVLLSITKCDQVQSFPCALIYKKFIIHTEDGGASWVGLTDATSGDLVRSYIFEVNPENPDIIYSAGGTCVSKSVDGGATWNTTDSWFVHVDPRCLKIYSASSDGNSDIVYHGNDGGIVKATDGWTWQDLTGTGLNNTQYNGLSCSETNKDLIWAGAQDGSLDNFRGDNWYKSAVPGDNGEAIIDPVNNDIVHFSCNGQYYRATNSGNSATSGINLTFMFPMVLHPGDNNIIYAGSNVVWKSLNQGSTWTTVSPPNAASNKLNCIEISKSNPDVIYAAFDGAHWYNGTNWVYEGGIMKASDGAMNSSSWTDITGSLGDHNTPTAPLFHGAVINDIVVDPEDEDHVYVCLGGFYQDHKIYESSNGGTTWVNKSTGLPNFPCHSIVFQEGTDEILYVGTEVGVYYWDKPNETWKKYCSGMPDCIVSDMEINYCSNTLRISTWGRGVWEADLIPAPAYTLSSNETWSSTRIQNTSVIVPASKVLRVTGSAVQVRMARNTSIIIKPGGKLIVDNGATITNGCGSMWNGIIVEGNKTIHQDLSTNDNSTAVSVNQGFLYLNDAHIENAYEAIRVWNPADGWVNTDLFSSTGGTGGIVRAINSHFLNNRRSAEFMYYQNLDDSHLEQDNLSYFVTCTFDVDDNHRDEHPFAHHATAWGVKNLRFIGCKFYNSTTITGSMPASTLGDGIGIIDASITVNDYNPSLTIAGNNLVRSEFHNLNFGIKITGTNTPFRSRVYHAKFEHCLRGILNEGVDNTELTGNEFKLLGNAADIGSQPHEGIILRQCNDYTIEQNSFSSDESPTTNASIGIRADGTDVSDNRIYKNTFDEIAIGNISNRRNQLNDGLGTKTGLTYECNQNDENYWADFAIVPTNQGDGIKADQGSLNISAGNEFSHNTNLFIEPSDFYNEGEGLQYYLTGVADVSNDFFPEYRSPRVGFTLNVTDPNDCPINFLFPDDDNPNVGGCITCLSLGGYSSAYSAAKGVYNNYKQKYLNLIDGGNTQNRRVQADTISNATALKDTMLAYAPNLSTVVLDILSRRNGLLGDTAQYLIMKSNAEGVTYEILEYLHDRVGLPNWMIDSIVTSRNNLTYRSYLLDTMTYYRRQKEFANYGVLRAITDDTLGFDASLYRSWLDSSEGTWARRANVNLYIHEGKYDSAEAVLMHYDTTLVLSFVDSLNFRNYKDYVNANVNWLTADSSIMHLDSAHLQELRTFAEGDEHKRGTGMARNVLNFFYDSLYFTSAALPEEFYAKTATEGTVSVSESEPKNIENAAYTVLKLYPNPAQNKLTIEYEDAPADCKLYIYNTSGVKYYDVMLDAGNGKVVLDVMNYPNGMYLARVEIPNKEALKNRFIVLK